MIPALSAAPAFTSSWTVICLCKCLESVFDGLSNASMNALQVG
eukprot:SAG22_NODE_2133_length_2960_cov_2.910870_3_plen_43_part_00